MFLRDIYLEADNRLISLNLKKDLAAGVSLVTYNNFLHVCHKHIVDMLGVIEESQQNTEIIRRQRHEAHGRFLLPFRDNADETRTPKQRTRNYFSWSPSHRGVKQWRKK